jgi:phage host-nuclease inhibitor protein Gam
MTKEQLKYIKNAEIINLRQQVSEQQREIERLQQELGATKVFFGDASTRNREHYEAFIARAEAAEREIERLTKALEDWRAERDEYR